jgi:hypothetical protein
MLQIKVIANEYHSKSSISIDCLERASAMKILRDVLRPSIMGYEIPIKQQPRRRAVSAPRKLGRTRNPHRRIPCEICEKEMIKRHVWNLNQ